MKLIAFTLLLVAAAACTTIFFVSILKPTSTGAFLIFAIWLIIPYAIMGGTLLFLQRKDKVLFHWCVIAILVSTGGILFLVNVIFWNSDAQGAIAVFMTPIYQGIALVISLPVVLWWTRNVRKSRGQYT